MSLGYTFEGSDKAGWKVSLEESLKNSVPENAASIINKPLPEIPAEFKKLNYDGKPFISLVLFYQYIEPPWTPKEHREALKFVINLGHETQITGRGRCATEGLNCTLTGPAENLRAFCEGLRKWNPIFKQTDFKITDGLEYKTRFKALTIGKKNELVAYGLPPEMAPSLAENETKHLEAVEYHKKMTEPNTVIIDIRNRYETEIGRFCPPPNGAEFIDPKVRNSHEFPKWLNLPETQEKLNGKQVMMYCTGGIRCERFSALLTQVKKDNPGFETKGEFMVRGGVERYIKTFPDGGFWKGKNFLFDKRQEQVPANKTDKELEKEVESCCCVCKQPWGYYRGGFKCRNKDCQVPVIVCSDCKNTDAGKLVCPLCEEGFFLREAAKPVLHEAAQKRKATEAEARCDEKKAKRAKHEGKPPSERIFVGNLPLVIDASTLRSTLGPGVAFIHWIPDRKTGLWYGSTFVQMDTKKDAKRVVEQAQNEGFKLDKKKRLRINFSPPSETDEWPPANFQQLERPPVPVNPRS
mmetsp:Transcript_9409/g.15196  ORF Transcript_9409/g.15196 Transcript_9409/m.15196 type:complete len:523 (+) Transcript_9409:53-1621(+)